jgi:hypothetical protein
MFAWLPRLDSTRRVTGSRLHRNCCLHLPFSKTSNDEELVGKRLNLPCHPSGERVHKQYLSRESGLCATSISRQASSASTSDWISVKSLTGKKWRPNGSTKRLLSLKHISRSLGLLRRPTRTVANVPPILFSFSVLHHLTSCGLRNTWLS